MTEPHGHCALDGPRINVVSKCEHGQHGITTLCRMGWPVGDCPHWHKPLIARIGLWDLTGMPWDKVGATWD